MSGEHLGAVRVAVDVPLAPGPAFAVFTEETGRWYRAGAATLGEVHGTGTLRIDPGVGGRLWAVPDEGPATEVGRVTVWEPGERLAFVDQRGTEVEVVFRAFGAGTEVVLEHRGLERLDPAVARDLGTHGWRRLAGWFEQHCAARREGSSDG